MYRWLILFITTCCAAFEPYDIHVTLRHIEPSGIGYRRGYTTLDAFFMGQECAYYPFLDLSAHGSDHLRMAGNFGGGFRYAAESDWIYGINFWYDLRQGDHRGFDQVGRCYHQVGVGLEALGPCVDFRFNFYQPVGKKSWRFSQTHFNDNAGITPIFTFKKQSTFTCLNAEMGGLIGSGTFCHCIDWSTYLACGPYMIKQHLKHEKWGVNLRLKADLTEYWTLEVRTGYDQLYLGSMQVTVALHIPLYPDSTLKQQTCCIHDFFRRALTQPVERLFEIMPFRTQR